MSLDLIRWEKQTVTPMHDSIQFDDGRCGILNGCEIAHMGANQLKISAGYIVILGRLIEVSDTTINAEVSTGAEVEGQLFIRLNLASDDPVQFITEASAVLTPLTQEEDANYTNGIYELQLATYKITATTLSGLDVVVPKIEGLGAAVDAINQNLTTSNGLVLNVDFNGDGKMCYHGADGSLIPFSSGECDLLWENPRPTYALGATTIDMNLEDYEFFIIQCVICPSNNGQSGSWTQNTILYGVVLKESSGMIYFRNDPTGINGFRNFSFSKDKINIYLADSRESAWNKRDCFNVPLKIWGSKGKLG